jgi:hypothetical protein
MRLRAWRVVSLGLVALGAAACTRNPYIIGTICPPAGAGGGADAGAVDPRCGSTVPQPNATLAAAFASSGAGPLGALTLASGDVQPALRLRGERATTTAWPAEAGGALGRGAGTPTPGLGAPFSDTTGAVGLPASAPAYVAPDGTLGAVGGDDFALEVVLRALPGATLFAKLAGGSGWALRTIASGALELDLEDGDATHAAAIASSSPLTSGAWYHCLFWVSRAAGGRADCDGDAGTLTALPPLGSLDAPGAALAAGGGAPIRVAHLALFRVTPGGLGDPSGWLAASARRFFTLAGVYPAVAHGTPLPTAGVRASAAYLDLQDAPGAPRRLFLVGPDWPRVACRVDAAGAHACGYLSEPNRARGAPADPASWQAAGVTVAASNTPFPDGEPRFGALAPSTAMTTHALSNMATAGSENQVFSFFVHRLTAGRVGASGGVFGTAVFDLAAGRVASAPAAVTATIEDWGSDVFRCSYAFAAKGAAGTRLYSVQLLDDAGNETFAGSGAATIEIGGLQVDDNLALAGSVLAADPQRPDRLTFVANDGNLPTGTTGVVRLSVFLPAGPRLTDQAILNLNRGGSFADQIQLNVIGRSMTGGGSVQFWRLDNGQTHWSFFVDAPVIDGRVHSMTASWDITSAHLVVDQATGQMNAQLSNAQAFALDRIDVGFSEVSSGALEGLVAGLQIGAM